MTKPIDQEIASVRAEIDAASAKLRALEERAKTPVPWEPKGGDYIIRALDEVCATFTPPPRFREANAEREKIATRNGLRFPTREAAESALPYLAFFQRLVALAIELNPSGKAGGPYRVYLARRVWNTGILDRDPWDLFETVEAAHKAAEIMNRDGWKVPSL
jgi:hypothetical protein